MKPGGLPLTKWLLQLCALPDTAKVLDVGCGDGQTLACLEDTLSIEAWGIDIKPGIGERLLTGTACALPFDADTFDALIFECSLSVIDSPDIALSEAVRVLKPKGVLYIADIYARSETTILSAFQGQLPGRFEQWEDLLIRFARAGLRVVRFEDHSQELLSYWSRLLFEGRETCCALPWSFRGGYFLALLEQEPFTPESLSEYHAAKKLKAIERAREKSLFYQEQEPAFTDAATLIEQGSRLLCTSLGEISRIRTIFSSGTTGVPKRIWFTEGDMELTVTFFAWAMRSFVRKGKRCVIMMSNDSPGSVADLLRRGLERIGVLSVIHGPIQGPNAADAAAEAECLVGLPAELFWLCRHAPHLHPETVLLSGDYISNSIIKAITTAWGCSVVTHYGLTETCYGLAVQCCAQEGHHIRLNDYIIEIIDPDTEKLLLPRQEGELVLTSLHNEAMPLIRYRTGDIGSLITGRCGCGSNLPRLGKIRGRRENLKNRIHIHLLDDIIFALPDINAYQAVLDKNVLHLTVEGHLDEKTLSEKLGIETRATKGTVFPYIGKRNILHKS